MHPQIPDLQIVAISAKYCSDHNKPYINGKIFIQVLDDDKSQFRKIDPYDLVLCSRGHIWVYVYD